MRSAINWFDIPAVDFDRAVTFYEAILGVTLYRAPSPSTNTMNGIFPADRDGGSTGAVCAGEGYIPSTDGSIVYLNADGDGQLDAILSRVEAAGGRILRPKMDIDPFGHIAWIIDSEGNRVGLHAAPAA